MKIRMNTSPTVVHLYIARATHANSRGQTSSSRLSAHDHASL